jgi:hypothetical protein
MAHGAGAVTATLPAGEQFVGGFEPSTPIYESAQGEETKGAEARGRE